MAPAILEVDALITRIRHRTMSWFTTVRPHRHGNRPTRLLIAVPPLALALLLAGCGQTAPTTTPKASPSTSTPKVAAVAVDTASVSVNGTSETVFTNSQGRTLYYFTEDTPTKAACSGSCAGIWPPFTTTASSVSAPAGVSGTFTIYHGANGNQVEYNGHPLYTYSLDTGPDQSHGEGVLGKWFVATPSLAVAASPSPSASSSSGGSGY